MNEDYPTLDPLDTDVIEPPPTVPTDAPEPTPTEGNPA